MAEEMIKTPALSERTLTEILRNDYDDMKMPLSVSTLDGWADRNFLVKTSLHDGEPEKTFVVKVMNEIQSREPAYIDGQDVVMLHLRQSGFACPIPISNKWGNFHRQHYLKDDDNSTGPHLVRLMEFVPGIRMDIAGPELTDDLLYDVGRYVASVNKCMQKCSDHCGFPSAGLSEWSVANIPLMRTQLCEITERLDTDVVHAVRKVWQDFEEKVAPRFSLFTKGLIHADCRPENLLFLENGPFKKHASGFSQFGVIDFGDTHNSFILFELAVSISHFMTMGQENGVAVSVTKLTDGFTSVIPLNTAELSSLEYCVAARLAQLIVTGTWYCSKFDMDKGSHLLIKQATEVLRNFNTFFKQ